MDELDQDRKSLTRSRDVGRVHEAVREASGELTRESDVFVSSGPLSLRSENSL